MANLRRFLLGVLFFLATHTAVANVWLVVDAQGQPVEGVILSIPSDSLPASPSEIAVMDQVEKRFEPELLIIQRGQQVTFPNSDNIRHHVYSFSPTKPFEIKLYKGTDVPPITFEQAGVVVLGCNIHDAMVGYIYVKGNELTFLSGKDGYVELSADTTTNMLAWHPQQVLAPGLRSNVTLDTTTRTIHLPFRVKVPAPNESHQHGFKRRKLGQ